MAYRHGAVRPGVIRLDGLQHVQRSRSAPAADQVAPAVTVQNAGDIKYYPSDEPLKLGLEYFKKGSYGIANRYFRDAVEKAPEDAEAWIGLAASYDRLRRFDLADQAYATAIKLTGETVQILNDRGYSYLLRGDLAKARAKFLKPISRIPPIRRSSIIFSSSTPVTASSNGYSRLSRVAAARRRFAIAVAGR